MSMIYYKDMFEEELERKKEAKEVLLNVLNSRYIYSKMRKKKISGKEYLYVYSSIEHKEKYIGITSPELEEKYIKLINKHKKVKSEIQEIEEDIPKIQKIINFL